MALTAEQRQIVRDIISTGHKRGATKAQIKAALETGSVESNFRNLPGGDADSKGWRQERSSLYENPNNVHASVKRIYDEMKGMRGSSGSIAARVQRPAAQYRGRYAQHSREAENLLRGFGGGASAGPSAPEATPAATDPTAKRAALMQYLDQRHQPDALLTLAQGLKGAEKTTAKPVRKAAESVSSGTPPGGLGTFEGVKVAAWTVPDLKYARAHGWKGKVNNGYHSRAEQTRIYNSGVRPAAKPGTSNHEGADYPRGAVDADPSLRNFLPPGSKLKWAGAKDPVHYSHPHGGSY